MTTLYESARHWAKALGEYSFQAVHSVYGSTLGDMYEIRMDKLADGTWDDTDRVQWREITKHLTIEQYEELLSYGVEHHHWIQIQ